MELLLPLEAKTAPQPPPPQPWTEAEMQTYAGTYANGALRVEIAITGGKPVLKVGGGEFQLTKLGWDRLGFTPPGATRPETVAVVLGRDGKPAYLHGGGRSLKKVTKP
jgi:hypothetical protein